MRKRLLASILACVMIGSLLAGCNNEPASTGSSGTSSSGGGTASTDSSGSGDTIEPLTEIPLPIVTDGTTLTCYAGLDVVDFSAFSNLAENPITQEFMKITGLNLEFQHPPAGNDQEHFNVMVAGGEIPDITFGYFESYYQGGSEQAVKDGLIIDVEPYIDTYAPNFKSVVLSNELANKIVHNDNGFLTGFGASISFDAPLNGGNVYGGPMVRKDLLEQAGLDVPVTIDDWSNMLAKFKELGVKYPYGWAHNGTDWDPMWSDSTFAMAWDIPANGFYPDEGVVKFAPMQEEWKNFVDLMASWFKAGYINPDFATQTYLEHLKYQCQMGEVGACDHHIFEYGSMSTQIDADGYSMIPVAQPVLEEGQKLRLKTDWGWDCGREGKYISATCKTPEVAVMFIDWLYTEQAKDLSNWGIEGVSYEIVDGKHVFTDIMMQDKNPDFEKTTRLYAPNVWKQNVSDEMNQAQYKLPVQKEAFRIWGDNAQFDIEGNRSLKFPVGFGSLPIDDATRNSEIMSVVNPYVQEYFIKCVMGLESTDTFDDFVATLKGMDIEEAIQIQQAAYDRFMAR